MTQWLRKWHVLLAVVIGVYLAVPKPVDPLFTLGETTVLPAGTELKTTSGERISLLEQVKVDEDGEFILIGRDAALDLDKLEEPEEEKGSKKAEDEKAFRVELDDATRKKIVRQEGTFGLRFPFAEYRVNLGQDLAGGTSLRYLIRSRTLVDAETKLSNLFFAWQERGLDAFPASAREKIETFTSQGQPFPDFDNDEIGELVSGDLLPESEKKSFKELAKQRNQIQVEQGAEDLTGLTIEKLSRRVNASGMQELNIVPIGQSEIEVKLPNLSPLERERLKQTLESTGALELLLLPNEEIVEDTSAKDLYPRSPDKNPSWYQWYEVLPSQTATKLDENDGLRYDSTRKLYVEVDPERSAPVFSPSNLAVVTPRLVETAYTTSHGDKRRALIHVEAVLAQTYHEKAPDTYPISGEYLKNALPTSDDTGRPAVSFELKGRGVSTMEIITGAHNKDTKDPRLLAVAIDNKIYSSASILGKLSSQVQVTGDFTRLEVQQYVDTLKSGSLPVSLTLVGEESVGPAEGADNVRRGVQAIILGAVLVLFFALLFYRRVGLLTILNLVLTIALILAIMSVFLSTLTLPGIAGLVLTLGMAIDANILINERIKEERRKGASGRAAIDAGFSKALSAIVDGNITTLITALILTKIGTGAVAGFALTLSIGILSTLYTALIVYRSSFLWCYEKKFITEVRGISFFENSNFNILKIGKKVALFTTIIALGALAFFFVQASSGQVFGVDFRGGSQVILQLEKPLTREEVENKIQTFADKSDPEKQAQYKNVLIQARSFGDEEGELGASTRWELRFPQPEGLNAEDADEIVNPILIDLKGLFGDLLMAEGLDVKVEDKDLTQVALIASFSVKRPEVIEKGDGSRLWLEEYQWDDPSAWLSSLGGSVEKPEYKLSQNGEEQNITLKVQGISISEGNTLDEKMQDFYELLKSELFEKYPSGSSPLVLEDPEVFTSQDALTRYTPEEGSVTINLALVNPEEIKSLETKLKDIIQELNDPLLQPGSLSIRALDAKDGKARKFELRSANGPLIQTEDGRNQTEVAASSIVPLLEDWFEQRGGENYISKPFPKATAIGSRVAGETTARAILALLIALAAIVVYVAVRFKSAGWGYAAVFALLHDTALTLGAIAVTSLFFDDIKIDLNAIAALLTVIGYSLNDTIVIFDRIREELLLDLRQRKKRTLEGVINAALNSTLTRTVLTSLSTFVVVLAMLFLGGPAIRTFSLTLFFGLIFGTYSSLFRSGPFLLFFTSKQRDIRSEIESEEKARKQAEKAEAEALAQISVERSTDESEEPDSKLPSKA